MGQRQISNINILLPRRKGRCKKQVRCCFREKWLQWEQALKGTGRSLWAPCVRMTDPGSARGKELQHSSIGSWGGRHTGSGSVSRPPGRCSLTEHCRSKALEQKRSGLGGVTAWGVLNTEEIPHRGTWQLMGYQKGQFKQNPQLPASNLRKILVLKVKLYII